MRIFSKFFGVNLNKNTGSNVKDFDSARDFWDFITKDKKWYLKNSPDHFKNIHHYISELAPMIITSTNELRAEMKFSCEEYAHILEWDNWLAKNSMAEKSLVKFKQYCSSCRKETIFSQRYPKSVCRSCKKIVTDKEGRKLEFFNTEALGYGCQGFYSYTEQQEKYDSKVCYINGEEFYAEEAKFGGIVIQLKE